jgi:tetratricopeptide (TPR) repeat protein
MSPEQRAEIESRADRHLRRGELSQAVTGFQAILAAFPQDIGIRRKLVQIAESLDPVDLRLPETSSPAGSAPTSAELEAERLLDQGDHRGALAAYRRAIDERPDDERLKQCLAELFEKVRGAPAAPRRTAGPDQLLRELLERIAGRKKA